MIKNKVKKINIAYAKLIYREWLSRNKKRMVSELKTETILLPSNQAAIPYQRLTLPSQVTQFAHADLT
jgi:hypothetical protein